MTLQDIVRRRVLADLELYFKVMKETDEADLSIEERVRDFYLWQYETTKGG